ncbi:unnamed protein product [Dovyalis caffra]|uniref:ADP-ribosyl cyclase/cyclic ADP-ribose hydrolase n=1 Tax=Dovyalis caffra TaxID=77055 RepID=A0AAV1QLC6_9ROSI|nr:unnamed protein product [Dovyalis caffra]
MASSSTSTPIPPKKYDVFLSFRGEDTRRGFTSHLYDALDRNKKILTFIDNDLVRGDEISSSLSKTIEESKLSVIIFSENYASSKWCLEELVQILECRKKYGQIVVPVFYSVAPSQVRNQTGSFGDAFDRLIKEKALAMDKVQSFRSTLKDAGGLSGRHLGEFELESEFVQKIVGDILKKLSNMSSSQTKDLVGIDARLAKIESLLNEESQDVSLVGIWGMGGIGKTTIAKAVLSKIQTQFDGTFFANFREELKRCSMVDLERSFLSQLLGQEILNGSEQIEGISLDTSKLSRETHLESDAFAEMCRLRFLQIFDGYPFTRLHLPSSGLDCLSDELRYLRWDGFPSKSLPQNFCAENLVELDFSWSKVEKLWRGVQDLVNLRRIELSGCECLTELPDLSKANNLEFLDLEGCQSLTEVPSSFQCLEKLETLYLNECYNLRSLPTRFDSTVLSELSMTKCLGISKCPEVISQNMKSLSVSGTSVRDVAGSITSTLETLIMGGCSNISKFPEGLRDIEELDLSGTAIEEVPSSIQFLTRLDTLYMRGCSKLESFPETTGPIKSLDTLDLGKTGIKQLPSSFKARDCASQETVNLRSGSISLDFSNCFKLDQKALSADMHLKIQSAKMRYIEMIFPGSEIPEWFRDQGVGSSVTIRFPLNCQQLKGIAFCFAFLIPSHDLIYNFIKGEHAPIKFGCRVKTKNGEHKEALADLPNGYITIPFYSDHKFLKYEAIVSENRFSKYSGKEVTFEFYPRVSEYHDPVRTEEQLGEIKKLCKVKRCGVYLHFDENLPSKKHSDEYLSEEDSVDDEMEGSAINFKSTPLQISYHIASDSSFSETERFPFLRNIVLDHGTVHEEINLNWMLMRAGDQRKDTVRCMLMRAGLITPPPMLVMGQKKGPSGIPSTTHDALRKQDVYSRLFSFVRVSQEKRINSFMAYLYISNDGHDRLYVFNCHFPCLSELAFSISHVTAKITVKTAKWMTPYVADIQKFGNVKHVPQMKKIVILQRFEYGKATDDQTYAEVGSHVEVRSENSDAKRKTVFYVMDEADLEWLRRSMVAIISGSVDYGCLQSDLKGIGLDPFQLRFLGGS